MKRLLTALVLAPLIVYAVVWGPWPLFLSVLLAVALLCFHEYAGIVEAYQLQRPGPLGYAAGVLVLLLPFHPFLVVTLAALAALGAALFASDHSKSLPSVGAVVFGLLYIFGAWRFAIDLRARSPYWLLFALALNWIGDSAAYYVGKALGRHKLAPRISPGKSWEGSAASLAASLLFGFLYLRWLLPEVRVAEALVLSGAGNLVGQAGDLAESALKRGAGVKDSGTMLPGHGGWLDRADSTLFAIPVIHLLLTLW